MNDQPTMEVNVDAAWERFKRKVQDEPVPSVWTHADSETRLTADTADVSLDKVDPNVVGSIKHPQAEGEASQVRPKRWKQEAARRHRQRRWRNASVAAVALVAVVGGAFATPWGHKVAADVVQTFYVQHLSAINTNDIQTLQNALGYGSGGSKKFDLQEYGSVSIQSAPQAQNQPTTTAQLAQATGYTIPTLPGGSGSTNGSNAGSSGDGTSFSYTPAQTATLQLHVLAINQLLQQLGGSATFPMSANNVPITLNLPTQVNLYTAVNNQYENLTMMRTPSVQVPDNVDLNQVRQAVVSLPFMPADIVSALEAQDWDNTLYVPQSGNSHAVTVDGHDVIVSTGGNGNQSQAMWVANGYFYALTGSTTRFPTDASILDAVKEISG